ncbi:MAG: tyrosine-type recombinase/integrase [Prevotellaceae bacterium]|nr:tyrosine-type recombinase/integrase [Prevotellaceae bacterium]
MEGIRQPVIAYIYNRYGKASATKDAVIELRIAYNNRQKYLSTGIRLYPREWHRGRVVNRLDATILNKTLDKLMTEVREIIYNMIDEGNIDIFSIPSRLAAKKKKAMTFLEYYAEKAENRKHGISVTAQGRYDLVLNTLKEFGKIIIFSDLIEKNIIAFDKFLINKGIMATSRFHNYHKFVKRFILEAQREGLIKINPYDTVRLDRGDYDNSIDKCLTLEEVKKLQVVTMEERLERVRDLFVFQCYTCLSYSDLAKFNIKKIEEYDGMKYYAGRRGKTKVRFTIPMLQPALDILEKYNNKLPIISNVKYNSYLKEVAVAAGIEKHLTTHWARHTGATLLLNAGVPIEVVSKVCGHSNTQITQKIYAKMLSKTIVEEVTKREEKLL